MDRRIPDNMCRLAGSYDLRGLDENVFFTDCRAMRASGYSEVYFGDIFFEVRERGEDGDVLFEDPGAAIVARPDDELLRIRQIVEEAGLAVGGAHFLQLLPAPGKPVEAIFPLHKRLVEMAKTMGLSRLTTHAGWQIGTGMSSIGVDDPKLHADCLEAYRNLCRLTGDYGIAITIETACQGWCWLDESSRHLSDFIGEVGAENLGVCLDTGHCHIVGIDVPKLIRQLGPLLTETHFHDNFGRVHQEFLKCDLHNPVGVGTLDWRAVIHAMCDSGYRGIITFEQKDYRVNATNWRAYMEAVGRCSD